MRDIWFAIPGDPETLTGGYVYARRLAEALPQTGWTPRLLAWPGTFPYPSGSDLIAVRRSLEALPEGAIVLADGLAYGALPTAVLDGLPLRYVALVHHPLARESGISEADAATFMQCEREALTRAQSVITTSPETARTLANEFGVPPDILHVALPGTEPATRATGAGDVPLILSVGTLTPRKGHDVLVEALALIRDIPWMCRIVGSRERDPATTAGLRILIERHHLTHRVTLAGEMKADVLRDLFPRADVFALASRYEGYGMVFAEALAHGLPIVACAAGAVPGTVPADAGILVPPNAPQAFAEALAHVLTHDATRMRLAEASWRHGRALPRWSDTAAAVADALTLAADAA